jgi:hypothetical protein
MELQIYRPGEEMVHPVSKLVLGAYEKALGTLAVAEVREKYSRGLLGEGVAGIVAGDRVRISSRRLRTLVHFEGEAPGVAIGPLAQALLAAGAESGRFTMIDESGWAPALANLGKPFEDVAADPAALRRLGGAVPADLLLRVRVGVEEGRVAVLATVSSLASGAALGGLRAPWPDQEAPPPPAAAAPAPEAAPAAAPSPPVAGSPAGGEGEYAIRELSTAAVCLAAGDILGEGGTDILLSDGAGLSLFRWEQQGLAWRWGEEGRGGRRVLALDAADVDGDGKVEVLAGIVERGRVRTEIRRWGGSGLVVVASAADLYLRPARRGAATVLLGQRAGIGEVTSGRVEEYRVRAGSIERVDGAALPRRAGVFGLALAGEGAAAALLSLDRGGFLRSLDSDGGLLWQSGRPYGGYPARVSARDFFGMDTLEESAAAEELRAFQGRLLASGTAGALRVFVPRNFTDSGIVLVRHREWGRGEIVMLEGTATNLEEQRTSRAFDGYVADLAAADLDRDGRPELLFVVNRRAGLLGERGRLVVWRLPG